MQISEIEKTWWTDAHARACLAWHVRSSLADVRVPIGTTALLAKIGVTMADGSAVKNCLAHLGNARKSKLLDGFFTAGAPTNGTRGFPSYKWHGPRLTENDLSERSIAYWMEKNGMTRAQAIEKCRLAMLEEMIGDKPEIKSA